ncbi:Crp/Fnr family transcriptional regulator [Rhodospirillum sp. A1_3_36]|uniref:Crp/Fnr family transcriptional regulator n=1 Tax=Rhodospirillum sp. A1_3_36 TaxID=3391666 RepID=UPI0039A6A558
MTPLDTLEKIAIFQALSTEGRKLLSSGTTLHRFTGGETVVHRGQDVSGAYFVMSGGLRVFTLSANGKEAPLYQITPGETCIIALNSLFNDLSYPAWVESERDTLVAVVPGRVYRTLFAQEACIQDITLRALSTLVFRLMGELENSRSQTVSQRLAGYLLANVNTDGRIPRTQQDIAARIGTTREVVARIMVDFSSRGLVETGRGWCRILSTRRLVEEAGSEPV